MVGGPRAPIVCSDSFAFAKNSHPIGALGPFLLHFLSHKDWFGCVSWQHGPVNMMAEEENTGE